MQYISIVMYKLFNNFNHNRLEKTHLKEKMLTHENVIYKQLLITVNSEKLLLSISQIFSKID